MKFGRLHGQYLFSELQRSCDVLTVNAKFADEALKEKAVSRLLNEAQLKLTEALCALVDLQSNGD